MEARLIAIKPVRQTGGIHFSFEVEREDGERQSLVCSFPRSQSIYDYEQCEEFVLAQTGCSLRKEPGEWREYVNGILQELEEKPEEPLAYSDEELKESLKDRENMGPDLRDIVEGQEEMEREYKRERGLD
jgi:hypothetical protein